MLSSTCRSVLDTFPNPVRLRFDSVDLIFPLPLGIFFLCLSSSLLLLYYYLLFILSLCSTFFTCDLQFDPFSACDCLEWQLRSLIRSTDPYSIDPIEISASRVTIPLTILTIAHVDLPFLLLACRDSKSLRARVIATLLGVIK